MINMVKLFDHEELMLQTFDSAKGESYLSRPGTKLSVAIWVYM